MGNFSVRGCNPWAWPELPALRPLGSNVLMRVYTIGIYAPKVAVGENEKGVFSEEK